MPKDKFYAKIKCHFQISENITDSGNTNSTLLLVAVASNTHPFHSTARTLREVFSSPFCFPSTPLLNWQKEASWTLWAFLWSIKLMPSHSLRKTVVQTHSAASEGLSNMEIQVGLREISINSHQHCVYAACWPWKNGAENLDTAASFFLKHFIWIRVHKQFE